MSDLDDDPYGPQAANEAQGDEENEDVENFVDNSRAKSVWASNGPAKLAAITKIIKYFGSLVVRCGSLDESAENDFDSRIMYQKAPNASMNILRARV